MAENLRTLLGSTDDYEPLSREERNFAAIVHHLLLQPGNLTRFLRLVGAPDPTESERTAVFFEYAYLRDLWDSRAGDPTLARAAILDWLSPPAQYGLEGLPILEWNTFFGASPLASSVAIQNPGRWSISEFSRHISEDDFFLRACMFKWAFNATPDLVIHTGKSSAVCIEAKLESGEGHYPASAPDIAQFTRRGLARVGQTEVLAYLMGQMLGFQTTYVFLVRSPAPTSDAHRIITWKECFAAFDWQEEAPFVKTWIERM